ncbi:hypothetical protein [Flavobacterium chungnamense]
MKTIASSLKMIINSLESFQTLSPFDYDSFISHYNRFFSTYKEIIDNYDNSKINVEKENYLKDPYFALYIIDNKAKVKCITAKVKWVFPINGEFKKLKYQSVHIGTTKQLGTDIESADLLNIAKIRIREYFNEKSPNTPVDLEMLKSNMEIGELSEKLRRYKDRIIAELNPTFYISKVSNKSSYKSIVANIKWGFPYPGRTINPRYISFYIGSENEISEDIKSADFINKIKPKVLEYLHKNLYSGSNYNIKK